MVAAAQAFIL